VTIARLALTTAGTIGLLKAGYGIIALGFLNLVVAAVVGAAYAALSARAYRELRFVRAAPERSLLKEIWGYSYYSFIINLAGSLIFQTSSIIIGLVVSTAAVTMYSIGGRLIDYHRTFTNAMSQTLLPVATGYGARGELSQLQRLLVHGTRLALFVAWPMEIVLFLRGETFIDLWMGPEYGAPAGAVLRILLISNFFIACNYVSAQICFGIARHKPYAKWQIGEALVNIVLSVILAHQWGIIGVAWGSTIPSLVTNIVIWPAYICRVLEIRLTRYLWQTWGRMACALLPFAVVTLAAERYWPAGNLLELFAQIALLLPVAIAGAIVFFWVEVRDQLQDPRSLFWKNAPWGRRIQPRVGRLFGR
jgi:O-antigen/teichoic acid export membrane protein